VRCSIIELASFAELFPRKQDLPFAWYESPSLPEFFEGHLSIPMPPRVDDYTTIDVGGDWPRLRLHCEQPKPRLALECAMRQWLKYDAKWHHEAVNWTLGRALQGEAPAPWELSRTGYWTCRIDNAVRTGIELPNLGAFCDGVADLFFCVASISHDALPRSVN
jgi:hypothetical protein